MEPRRPSLRKGSPHAHTPPQRAPGTGQSRSVADGAATLTPRPHVAVRRAAARDVSGAHVVIGTSGADRPAVACSPASATLRCPGCSPSPARTSPGAALRRPRRARAAPASRFCPVKEEMEARLGADFSDVRVHTDSAARASAAEVGARAYTSGSHVVIGDDGADEHHLAHELTHILQQRQGPVAGTNHGNGLKVSDPSDVYEEAAEANAARVDASPAESTSGRQPRHEHPLRRPTFPPRFIHGLDRGQLWPSCGSARAAATGGQRGGHQAAATGGPAACARGGRPARPCACRRREPDAPARRRCYEVHEPDRAGADGVQQPNHCRAPVPGSDPRGNQCDPLSCRRPPRPCVVHRQLATAQQELDVLQAFLDQNLDMLEKIHALYTTYSAAAPVAAAPQMEARLTHWPPCRRRS